MAVKQAEYKWPRQQKYDGYEDDVGRAFASMSPANGDLYTESARQGARRTAQAVADWYRKVMGLTTTASLPDSLQKLLETEAPD